MDDEDFEEVEIASARWSWRLTLGNALIIPSMLVESVEKFIESLRQQCYSAHFAYRDEQEQVDRKREASELLAALDEI